MGATVSLVLAHVDDDAAQRNFVRIAEAFAKLAALCGGHETQLIALSTGDNLITPPGQVRPRARITVYQDAPADLSDGGLQADGKWKVTASAPCRARFLFF